MNPNLRRSLAISRPLASTQSSISLLTLRSRLGDLSRARDHVGLLSLYARVSRTHAAFKPDRPIYLLLLNASASLPSRLLALSLHSHVLKSGLQNDIFVSTTTVSALGKCLDVDGARNVFDQMPEWDVGAWNAMLSCYVHNEHVGEALALFRQMHLCGCVPNSQTLSILLQACSACSDTSFGRAVHAYAVRHLELGDTFLGNSLVVHYSKLGDVHVSERLFEGMTERNIVSWNAMIGGYTQNGLGWGAVETFCLLREQGLCPDLVTLETTLQACAHVGNDAVEYGRSIHATVIKLGSFMDAYAENSLLLMYCKCGMLDSAQSLFDTMEARNVVSWSILVDGFIRDECPDKALRVISCMRLVESELSSELLVSALKALRLLRGDVGWVLSVHALVILTGFGSDAFVSSSLIAAYGDYGEIGYAHRILDNVKLREETVCWNALLSVYANHGYIYEALELLHQMQLSECTLDAVTLVNGLSVCTLSQNIKLGKAIHSYIIRNRFESVVFVTTSLMEFYFSSELFYAACCLFLMSQHKNLVTWNTLLHGCLLNGFPRTTLKLFLLMQQQGCFAPDSTSIVAVIEAIALRGHEREREHIHDYVFEAGFVSDEFIANALISMHSRFQDFDKVSIILNKGSKPSIVTWNNMIARYSDHGLVDKALSACHLMKFNNVEPDSVTFLCLLRICAVVKSMSYLARIHTTICKAGFESDVEVGSALVNLYAKCGDVGMAQQVFDSMSFKTIVSWNSMLQGYGLHGNIEEASILFCELQKTNLTPNMITFIILISACSHAGDLGKAHHYFNLMTSVYAPFIRSENIESIIDLLGRNGLVEKVHETLEKMPMNPGPHSWGALLGACQVQGNLDIGFAAAENLFKLNPLNCGYLVLLSNMLAEAGRWAEASLIRREIENNELKKESTFMYWNFDTRSWIHESRSCKTFNHTWKSSWLVQSI